MVLETKKPIKSWTGAEEAVLRENLMERVEGSGAGAEGADAEEER